MDDRLYEITGLAVALLCNNKFALKLCLLSSFVWCIMNRMRSEFEIDTVNKHNISLNVSSK